MRSNQVWLSRRAGFSGRRRRAVCLELCEYREATVASIQLLWASLRAIKKAFAISYADLRTMSATIRTALWNLYYQHMAVLGIVVTILGFRPRRKPRQPSRFLMISAAPMRPFTLRSSGSVAFPLV